MILLYDGDCAFCTRVALWAQRRLPADALIVPWQQCADLAGYGLTIDDVSTASYWLDDDDRPWRGARGVAQALMRMGVGWKVIGFVIDAPGLRWITALGYRVVVRFRHRLPGGTAACRIDPP